MGGAVSDDDLKALAMRFRQANQNDTELRDAVMRMQSDPDFRSEMGNLVGLLLPRATVVSVVLAGANGTTQLGAPVPSESPFRNGLPAGDYTVQVQAFDCYAKELSYNGGKLTGNTLRVAPGADGTVHLVMSRDMASIAANVTDTDGKPLPNVTVVVIPESVTSVPLLSRAAIHGQTDQNGSYISRLLAPGKYRVLATTQAIRWGVPDDLEKVLLVLFQAKDVDLDGKAMVVIAVEPVPL
jgi:hypothetical protein